MKIYNYFKWVSGQRFSVQPADFIWVQKLILIKIFQLTHRTVLHAPISEKSHFLLNPILGGTFGSSAPGVRSTLNLGILNGEEPTGFLSTGAFITV